MKAVAVVPGAEAVAVASAHPERAEAFAAAHRIARAYAGLPQMLEGGRRVKTPEDNADREQLSTAQILKEQYWKRTIGPVRSALEDTLIILDKYGFEVEMGHKEVGGVKAKFGNSGHYDHVMEQLEIDWKSASCP